MAVATAAVLAAGAVAAMAAVWAMWAVWGVWVVAAVWAVAAVAAVFSPKQPGACFENRENSPNQRTMHNNSFIQSLLESRC